MDFGYGGELGPCSTARAGPKKPTYIQWCSQLAVALADAATTFDSPAAAGVVANMRTPLKLDFGARPVGRLPPCTPPAPAANGAGSSLRGLGVIAG